MGNKRWNFSHNDIFISFLLFTIPCPLIISTYKTLGFKQEYFGLAYLSLLAYANLFPVLSWYFLHKKHENLHSRLFNFHFFLIYGIAATSILIHLLNWGGIIS